MVSVKDGERQAFFYLNVDLNLLKSKYVNYANKKLCLVVEISDPSKYELNEALSKTKVIINASAFMPTPVILTGGEFDDSSVPFWSKTSIDGTTPTLENALKIENGNLIIDFGTGNVTRSVAISHPVELEMGLTYKFSAAASWTGATSAELFFILSTVKPTSSMGYNKTNNYFTALDVWLPAPNFSTSGSGIFPQVGKYEKGINRSTGEFTANFTQGYVVVLATCWGGNVGLVTIDRIKIEEL